MEKLEPKHKESNMYTYHQPVSVSTTPPADFILSYDKCDYDNFNDYNKLSSIKEHASICQNCKRKYLSRNLIDNLSCMDSNTRETLRNNLQNEWKLLALIVSRLILNILYFFKNQVVHNYILLFLKIKMFGKKEKNALARQSKIESCSILPYIAKPRQNLDLG